MGFQFRRRTKGKNGWVNFSYSDRNGFRFSPSVKVGGITHNFGLFGRNARTTFNLGGGMRYVNYWSRKKDYTINNDRLLEKFDRGTPTRYHGTLSENEARLKTAKFAATWLPVCVFFPLTWVFYHIFQWFR